MPRGSKAKYTAEQKRKAAHIEDSYEHKGLSKEEAEARAWATVNKQSGGGEKAGGSGQRKSPVKKPRTAMSRPSGRRRHAKDIPATAAPRSGHRPRKV